MKARRHRLVNRIERGLERCGVLGAEDSGSLDLKVIVGVSGGADSVSLLLGILAISQRSNSKFSRRTRLASSRVLPIAVHVHHHLRDSADADAEWVNELCDRFDVPLYTEHVHPGALKGNLASNARKLRYAALQRIAQQVGATHVAVAHHAEDQLETMLIALCRGTGLDGLSGMPWSRPLDDSIMLVRPLLGSRKGVCEDFCRAAGIQWREDPSNQDTTKRRTRLRRDVMPVLEELWPGAARRSAATTDVLLAAQEALRHQIEVSFGPPSQRSWDRRSLAALASPIIAAGLRRAALDELTDAADKLGQRHLIAAADAITSPDRRPRKFEWPGGLMVKVTSKSVSLSIGKSQRRKVHRSIVDGDAAHD